MRTRRFQYLLAIVLIGSMTGLAWAQPRDHRASEPRASVSANMKRDTRAWPTGDRATSVLLLERITPAEVRVNEEFTYEIRVTNITRGRIDDVTLVEQFPASFKIRSISPEPGTRDAGKATWTMRALEPNATQGIQVIGSTDKPEQLDWCATMTFRTLACISTKIVEPQLVLEKEMLPEATPCMDIPIRIRVSNKGSGVARNVMVTDNLPEGLSTRDGKTGFTFRAGDLGPGQTKEANIIVRAAKTGTFTNTAKATEDGGLTAEASATTVVRTPVLTVTKACPDVRFVGRPVMYDITVTNTGDAPAMNTTLTDQLPAGASFVSAEGGGRPEGGRVTWSLGNLAPGASQSVHVTLQANEIGKLINRVFAKAVCAEAEGACETTVKGIAAILLEVTDDPDPVELGNQTTYTIEVTNQGSSVGTNIVVECTLPAEEEFVSAGGATNGTGEGKTVRFAPLPSLAPKARAVWKVTIKGTGQGDVRFLTTMKSDEMSGPPVQETESTHIYE